jgi:hypothetical protein
MTDGRDDVLADTIELAAANVPHSRLVIHDDTGDNQHRFWLAEKYRHLHPNVIGGHQRSGFGGAIRNAWTYLQAVPEPFVVHVEDDFLLTRKVDWIAAANVLVANPHLVQLALRRQPWNPEEEAAGGIVEQHPDDYTEREWEGYQWLEHTRFFTTNPSIYRRTLCDFGWPDGENSEGRFGIGLLEHNPSWRFGFWGSRDSGEWCQHIGHERVGHGY